MESSEISTHQARVYKFAAERQGKTVGGTTVQGWFTASELAEGAQIAPRTARAHALSFVRLGVFDQAEVFPAHRYRLSELADKRNVAMVRRLKEALVIFGLAA